MSFFKIKITMAVLIMFSFYAAGFAETVQIQLYNWDTVTGEWVEENEDTIIIRSETLGELTINKADLFSFSGPMETVDLEVEAEETVLEEETVEDDSPQPGDLVWDNNLALGFSWAFGNSDLMNINGSFNINRNIMWVNEWTVTGSFDYREDTKETTYQKAELNVRYGHSFNMKLYGFISAGLKHDFSSLLDYEVLPAAGLGFWVSDADDLKIMAEAGVGYQYSYYNDPRVEQDVIAHIRGIAVWQILPNVSFDEDFKILPVVTFDSFTLNNSAALTVDIVGDLSLKLAYLFDYNSNPSTGVEKADHSYSTQLEWDF